MGPDPSDPVARFYGAVPLDKETSKNISAGIVFEIPGGYIFTADYFNIRVDQRIALTSRIPITSADRTAMSLLGIDPGDVQSVRFFGNYFDTKTQGFDAVFSKTWRLAGDATFNLAAAVNYTKTDVTRVRDTRAVDRERRIEIGAFNPQWRGNVTGNFRNGPLSGLLRLNYFGKWTDAVPNAVPTANAFDQTFGAKWLIDAEIGYDIAEEVRVAVGAENLFGTYPDRDRRPGQQSNGSVYPQFSPFGFNGGFWYARVTTSF